MANVTKRQLIQTINKYNGWTYVYADQDLEITILAFAPNQTVAIERKFGRIASSWGYSSGNPSAHKDYPLEPNPLLRLEDLFDSIPEDVDWELSKYEGKYHCNIVGYTVMCDKKKEIAIAKALYCYITKQNHCEIVPETDERLKNFDRL